MNYNLIITFIIIDKAELYVNNNKRYFFYIFTKSYKNLLYIIKKYKGVTLMIYKTEQERITQFIEEASKYKTLSLSAEFINWLKEKDFFKKPAAVHHHGNYEGGLFDHSLAVAQSLNSMTNALNLKWQNARAPFVVGMFHDLCKLDDYIKSNSTSSGWEYNEDKCLSGHGDKSIMILAQFMTLTEEEMLCIRFHMGAYNTDDWKFYDKAIRKYETVLWTHTADMYASKVLNI